ncbi:MAG: hypothetical protein ABIQ96_10730 [Luteolibacter sp.]
MGLMHVTFSTASLTIRFDDFALKVNGAPRLLPTPDESWTRAIFGANSGNPDIAGPSADPDGDGLTNTNEFLTLTHPNDGSDVPVVALVASIKNALVTMETHARCAFSTKPAF